MMKKNSNLISSQQSPEYICKNENKYKESFYGRMFIEDFCQSFSISLSTINESREFYVINSKDDILLKLLNFEDNDYLKYVLDQQLQRIMLTLIYGGKAFVETVLLKDEGENLFGILFVPLAILKSRKHKKTTTFYACQSDNKKVQYEVSNNNLIVFDLTDLGFHSSYFIKLINKMKSLDIPDYSTNVLNPKFGFDINRFKQLTEFKLLKLHNRTFWDGRDYNNQYLSESYMLYRKAHYKLVRLQFLDYLLTKYNQTLRRLGENFGFSGEIVTTRKRIDYEDCLSKLTAGQLNTSQACKIIIEDSTDMLG